MQFQKNSSTINRGDIFIHTKRGLRYQILDLVRDADSLEMLVIYQGLYNSDEFGHNPKWCRKLDEFLETVEINGVMTPRFKKEC